MWRGDRLINTSNEYKEAVKDNRQFVCSARTILINNTELTLTHSEILSSGFSFEEGVSGSGTFDIGAAVIGKFKLMIDNIDEQYNNYDFEGATIYPRIGLRLSSSDEIFNKGVYTVDEVTSSGGVIVITALDNLSKFEKEYDSPLAYPASLADIVIDACNQCGVPLLSPIFDNCTYIVKQRPTDCTYLDIISYVAQMAGCFAKCDNNGYLTLKWYDTSVFESDSSKYHQINQLGSQNISAIPVLITGVEVAEVSEDSNEVVSYMYGEAGYVLSVLNNPLIQKGDAETIAKYLGTKIIGMQFYPLTVTARSDPSIEAGDAAIVIDRKGREYRCYLTNIAFTVGDMEAFNCDAETPSKNSAVSKSALTKAIIKAREEAKNDFANYEKSVQQLTDLLSNSLGYYITTEYDENGGIITYMHDKPTLEESQIIWKKTIEGFGVSTDGGVSYNSGVTAEGNATVQTLKAHGIDTEWLRAGIIKSATGNSWWNLDTGEMQIAGTQLNDTINSVIFAYMRFVDGQLVIGSVDSNYQTMINDDSFNILYGNNVVATFSHNALIVDRGIFADGIQLGNVIYQPYDSGLAHKWGG